MITRYFVFLLLTILVEPANTQKEDRGKKTDDSVVQRRLLHLEYVLRPPEQEDYSFENEKIVLVLDKEYFAFFVPKGTKPEDLPLWPFIPDKLKKAVRMVYSSGEQTFCLLPRSCLEGMDTQQKLRKAAREGKLPRMTPVWKTKEGGTSVVPLGTVSLRLKRADADREELLKFLNKNGLRPYGKPREGTELRFDLPIDECIYPSPFAAARVLRLLKEVRWAEPDLAPEVNP